MRFECDATLELSAAVDAALLKKAVEDAKPLLLKGAPSPQEGCAITEWKASDAALHVLLRSGRYVRAHSGLMRLRNHLNAALGKAAKAGVRSVRIERYEISGIELPKPPLKPIRVHFFVDDLKTDGNAASLTVSNTLPVELIEAGAIDRIVELVRDKAEKQHYEGKEEIKECFWMSAEKEMRCEDDPATAMEKTRWIKRTHAKGQFVYGRNFTALANAFKAILKEHLYEPLGFGEMIFPKFEPWEVPSRSGHAKSIYPDAYFVCVPRVSSPAEWEPEMDYFRITGEVLRESILKKSVSAGIMSYAQCPPFWQYLEGRVVKDASLPLRVYDWSGPTYRNEAGGTSGIARLEEFHRVETLFVGSPQQVKETGAQVQERLTHIFESVLDLEFRKCNVTPWWMAQEGEKKQAEKPETGTVDFEAYLPFRGKRDASEWLEIQNVSVIGDKYPKAFGVKAQRGELWSGCGGGSVQRWICAFLSQKGLDAADWPEDVRRRMKLQNEVEFA